MGDIADVNDVIKPPRISQSVHGYLELTNNYPTRLDLSNSWDKDEVLSYDQVTIDDETSQAGSFVMFYAINTETDKTSNTFRPMRINPRPYPIKTTNTSNEENMLKNISKVEKINRFRKGYVTTLAQNFQGLHLIDRNALP